MLKRYPHIGTIVVSAEDDPADGITTATKTSTEIIGRFEPVSQSKALDYSAKFYCKKTTHIPFEVDGHAFLYEGKQFKIIQFHNYQTYCEIWLE